jgi:hypothetical protein
MPPSRRIRGPNRCATQVLDSHHSVRSSSAFLLLFSSEVGVVRFVAAPQIRGPLIRYRLAILNVIIRSTVVKGSGVVWSF